MRFMAARNRLHGIIILLTACVLLLVCTQRDAYRPKIVQPGPLEETSSQLRPDLDQHPVLVVHEPRYDAGLFFLDSRGFHTFWIDNCSDRVVQIVLARPD
jgi:hypothetical protein